VAHGDFYFTINATFHYFTERWGKEALVAYWQTMGREYLAPLADQSRSGGLEAIFGYWSEYFAHEPGGDVAVSQVGSDRVVIEVHDCPAIAWLTRSQEAASHPPVHPMFCQHCLYVNQAMLESTGHSFTLEGGGGSCRQVFARRSATGAVETSEATL
jgi:hypothetical protein